MNLYFDNAATSYPKPEEVHAAVQRYGLECGASAGRGAYRQARQAGDIIAIARARLARLFNAPDPERVIFTLNCTDALNLAIKGLVRPGGHVVYTAMEHNSVLRPLRKLVEAGAITTTRVPADHEGRIDPRNVILAMRPETCLVAVVHASNVSGTLQPVEEIAPECRRRGIPLLLDAAQSAGHVPIDVTAMGVDLLAAPGHKGLLGPLGTGVLIVRPGLELDTLREGGTGSRSEEDRQPDFWPDRHEAGSHNLPGISGLSAGVDWLLSRGVAALRRREEELMRLVLSELPHLPGVSLYGPTDVARRVGVFSFRIEGMDPLELGRRLDDDFGVKVRSGLHCAPAAHRALGTFPDGTVRASLGHFHEEADVAALLSAVERLTTVCRAGC
ncbi:aminotransferase class V-fold PLP-dependent enzyme [bacterium]|nr:aminotransferase class V-fold PLP-dependent enzyme [bacterium]